MVDEITRSSADLWTRALDDDDEVRRRSTPLATTRPANPPEPPDLPDVNGALLARMAAGAAPRPTLAMGIDASLVRSDQDAPAQKGLDAFKASATPTYRIPTRAGEAAEVSVATPFRMVGPSSAPPNAGEDVLRYVAQERRVMDNAPELQKLAAKLGIRDVGAITVGRGTPAQVRALTQALLDAGKLPPAIPGEPTEVRVRRMMCDYGIGFDCAGYTQQALLAAHGLTRAQAGLHPDITSESLSGLSGPRFSRVVPEEARAGDVLALAPPDGERFGHRVIVFDRHDASPEELQRYCRTGQAAGLARGRVSVLTVDSSFGSGAYPAKGGVQRQTWLYDAATRQWGTVFPAHVDEDGKPVPERVRVHDLPYDGHHPLIGVFHYSGRR